MRFLHTADWHLGRIFHGLHLTNDQAYVLDALVSLAKDAKTDAILISGDVYDRGVPPTEAVNLLNEILSRLIYEAGQNVILIAGNHDSGPRLGFAQNLLAQHKLFITGPLMENTAPIVLEDTYGPVYFAPLTYAEPYGASEILSCQLKNHEEVIKEQVRQQLEQIPQEARKVALAHVFLSGAEDSPDSERPLSIGGASTVPPECFLPFNYAALGHLHACQGKGKIRYSGSLMKYSFNEASQKKGVHIIDLNGDGNINAETVYLNPRRDLTCLTGSFDDLCKIPKTEYAGNYLQIVLTDEQPVLDAKNRLEKIYPYILHLQYQRLQQSTDTVTAVNHTQRSPEDLFEDFFKKMKNRPLNESEKQLLFEAIKNAEREAE
ncbi:MAG: exonuclease SbcCD subunit D [Phascolarctobacterium sp.]|nr:exonuclease SbcCD subunit D [Phascolarctobacterium sp.]